MRTFSISKAGFSGYRLLASKPVLALWWFVFSLVVSVASIAALVWLAGPQMTAMREIQEAGPGAADPATVMELSRQMLPYQVFGAVFPWVVWVISIGAVARAMLGRGRETTGHLGFGADELRLLVTTLVTGVLIGLACLAVLIAALIALVGGGGLGALRSGHLPPSTLVVTALVVLLGVAAVVFLTVKLSLSAAQTVNDGSIRIFSSWTITKGRFWPILGAYVLALLPVAAGWILGLVLMAALTVQGAGGQSPIQMLRSLQPDVSSMAAAFQPKYLLIYVIGAMVRTLSMAGLIAPSLSILQALHVDAQADDLDDDDD